MRNPRSALFLVVPFVLGSFALIACSGEIQPLPPGSSSGASSSGSAVSGSTSGSSSGSTSGSTTSGTTISSGASASGTGSAGSSGTGSTGSGSSGSVDCSGLGVPTIAKVCPDGSSVGGMYAPVNGQCILEFPCPVTTCEQGAACSPGTGCGTAVASPPGGTVSGNCGTSCSCDDSGHLACTVLPCAPPPPPTGCTQGAVCMPNEGCGTGSAGGPGIEPACSTTCGCDTTGHFQCTVDCPPPPAVDAGPPVDAMPAGDGGDPCTGYALPKVCEVCSDGTTQCEHFVVVDGQCAIEICPGKPVPVGL